MVLAYHRSLPLTRIYASETRLARGKRLSRKPTAKQILELGCRERAPISITLAHYCSHRWFSFSASLSLGLALALSSFCWQAWGKRASQPLRLLAHSYKLGMCMCVFNCHFRGVKMTSSRAKTLLGDSLQSRDIATWPAASFAYHDGFVQYSYI